MTSLLHSTVLLEGITHIEDLPLKEFIRTVESLKDKIVTEKLDGSNLWFGLDDIGVFTSREGKSPKGSRFYNVDDYAMVANYNGFRAAHLAVEKIEPEIRKYLQEGDMVEMEVLFGRQPNTVTYGVSNKNFIVILRGVNGTPDERVNQLSDAINGKKVTVESTVVSSPDGDAIELDDEKMLWEFTQVKPIDGKNIDTSEASSLLKALKKFIAAPNETFPDKTNEEVSVLSLTSIPKEKREEAKQARDTVNERLLNDFKNPIKELLLNRLVRKIKPFLQADDLHPSEDIGVEGVVVRDPVTGSQTKIVDKDVFTAINTFNSAARATAAGLVRTTDQEAASEMRGGAFGQAKIKIANLLGAKELALSSGVKRHISKFKGDSVQSTAQAIADNLDLTNFTSVKRQVSQILTDSLAEVNSILDGFKKESNEYKLTLKTGKEIGITPEVMKRTLTAFAETKKDIAQINARVLKSNTPSDLVMALYGKTIESLFSGADSEVKESMNLLKSINEDAEGGGGDGGEVATTSAASTSDIKTTTSSNIAPAQTQLFKNGRAITRRKRNFIKPKKFPAPKAVPEGKFSMLKTMQEEWAHVKDMKFATDVDDKAASQNDIEFKQLRNTVSMGDEITPATVNQYLDKAHELNDEVDTVTFGMETDTGHIVKVYVNANQADDFEVALSDILSQENETEAVVNTLADKFDIVDVEWPEGMTSDTPTDASSSDVEGDVDDTAEEESGDDDMDFGTASDSETEDNGEESEDDMDFSTASDGDSTENNSEDGDVEDMDFASDSDSAEEPAEDGEEEIADENSTEDSDSEETDSAEDSDVDPYADEEESDSEESDEESTDEESDEEEEETDDFGQPIKKRKKKTETTDTEEETMEESMKTVGQLFKARLLEGSKPKKKKDEDEDQDFAFVDKHAESDAELSKILRTLGNVKTKAVVTLLIKLGAPIKAMTVHRAELKKATSSAAEMFATNASFRLWTKKLLDALVKANTVTEATNLSDRLTNKYQHMLYDVLKALGLPESVERSGQRQLLNNIREIARVIVAENDVKMYFKSVADLLGVSDKTRDMSDVKESVLTEANTESVDAVNELLAALGFDVNKPTSIVRQENMPAVKSTLMKLASSSTIMNKMSVLTNLINAKTKHTANNQQAGQKTAQFASQDFKNMTMIAEKAEDRGEWNIGKMGSNGLVLTLDEIKIKISKEEAEKLSIGLEQRKKVSVRAHGDTRYVFKPLKHGAFSVAKNEEDADLMEEILISKEQVADILSTINTED